ncbi:MAG TPA: DUF2188 domain-containing protein [Thermoanaerobaculia bacterium]|nr:DUF2188 domain-containing protein [Thermoanaerobaculia bacterium]
MPTASKANGRVVYHVVPNSSAEKWVVSQENADYRSEHDTKEEAVKEARRLAQEAQLGQIKVHLKNGNMEYESTYGEDPPETPS